MEKLQFLGTLMAVGYLTIIFRIFPKGRKSFDVFKLNPKLLPFWMKYIGLLWLLFVFIYSAVYLNLNFSENTLLLVGTHFGLILIAFSNDKNEDEYSLQVRLKAMYVSIISLFLITGIVGAIEVRSPGSFSDNAFYFYLMSFDATLFVYLTYYYFTKYWSLFKRNH